MSPDPSEAEAKLVEIQTQRVAIVVEDEWLIRMEVADALAEAGWLVFEAGGGEEASTILRDHPQIDLLVTDIRLDGPQTGWDVAEAFRRVLPEIAVIYASANPPIEARMVAKSAFIDKPSRTSEIVSTSDRLWLLMRTRES